MALNIADSAADAFDGLKSRLGFGHKDDEYDDYSDRPVGGFRPATTRSSRSSRFGRGESAADNLVSIDDVKRHTRVPDRLQRDPLAPADDMPAGSPRSDGYDSLFEPTTETPAFTPYDPYVAYSSSSPSTYSVARPLTVIKPVVYGDVERVARAVKSGDVVVLVMRNTPDELSKRILDFSFGVASALDANVECPGEKVFAIARGNGLSEDEKTRLRNQGAL